MAGRSFRACYKQLGAGVGVDYRALRLCGRRRATVECSPYTVGSGRAWPGGCVLRLYDGGDALSDGGGCRQQCEAPAFGCACSVCAFLDCFPVEQSYDGHGVSGQLCVAVGVGALPYDCGEASARGRTEGGGLDCAVCFCGRNVPRRFHGGDACICACEMGAVGV